MFTGRELDAETGLFYYRARYFSAELGRFLARDPLGFSAGDFNLFRYCGGSVIGCVDPFGEQWYNPYHWIGRIADWWYGNPPPSQPRLVYPIRPAAGANAASSGIKAAKKWVDIQLKHGSRKAQCAALKAAMDVAQGEHKKQLMAIYAQNCMGPCLP